MNIRIAIVTQLIWMFLAVACPANAENLPMPKAGATVSIEELNTHGIGKYFYAKEIPQTVFNRMQGKSYKSYCTVRRSELRYLRVLHYNIQGEIKTGELVCHKDIADDLLDIFKHLFKAKYPIERIMLIDDFGADDERAMEANNTSCFNFRFVSGTRVPSNHSWGKAIDINPLYNPYVKKRRNGQTTVSPAKGRAYADRTKNFKYKINRNDTCYKEFIKHGFVWGGSWKSVKDYQHFEKK